MAAAKRRRLTADSRAFIVRELACFANNTEVVEAVYREFGVEITAHNVEKYDPTKQAGKSCAKKWKELFADTREGFLKHMEDRIPEAHKAVRVHKLAKAARRHEKKGNYGGMADMLERIAKEIGGAFTNRREVTGKKGGPIKYQDIDLMTEEEVDAELKQYGFDPDVHPAPAAKQ